MKNKLIALFLCTIFLFSLAGCVSGEISDNSNLHSNSDLLNNTVQDSSVQNDKNSEITQDSNSETPSNPSTDENVLINQPIDLTLRYDDRYVFQSGVKTVEITSITSKQAGTDQADTNIIALKSNRETYAITAVGVGTAKITLHDGTVYNLTVTPAPISVFLIIGQNNAEGSTLSEKAVYVPARKQSILCGEGQIYSTYAWSTNQHANYVAGIQSVTSLEETNAPNFVAKTLTSNIARSGTTLEYPLNALTPKGLGKTGFDSGLAWNWNKLTGEKVWVVNCAADSSNIQQWMPEWIPEEAEPNRINRYNSCVTLMREVAATMNDEIAAGHYTLSHFAYFLLQGEDNKNMPQVEYDAYLQRLHTNLQTDIKIGDRALEACGILSVRAFSQTNDAQDVADNGPRLAQKAAAAAGSGLYQNVYMACDINDTWISDQAVTDYWENTYPGSTYPFPIRTQTYGNPITLAEVHTGAHYLQPGYNELGIIAAQNAYNYFLQ